MSALLIPFSAHSAVKRNQIIVLLNKLYTLFLSPVCPGFIFYPYLSLCLSVCLSVMRNSLHCKFSTTRDNERNIS